jgi:NodT family efflux transporter outer membrane factor (OMF) lipoprotein
MRQWDTLVMKLVVVALGLAMGGCAAVGPDYKPVSPDAPASWHSDLARCLSAAPADPAALAKWWKVFHDPLLETLEKEAVKGNLSLKEAVSRVREARGYQKISRSGLLPFLDASASATKSRSIDKGEQNRFDVGFDAGWELDIFGGRRRAVEASNADLAASQEDLNDVLVSLTAEVGLSYIDVRTFQRRLRAARENLTAQEHTYELNRSRAKAGLADELAVQQARYNLEQTRAQIPVLETGLTAAMNRLAVLLGERPGMLQKTLSEAAPVPLAPTTVAVGVPAETLRRRPDIRRAERELAAQTARIGVAAADLYPKFHLNGSIGLESLAIENLPEWSSRIFSIGPSATWNLFSGGAVRGNIAVQEARRDQALIQYRATVLGALEEVENALVAYSREKDRLDALSQALAAARKADLVARDRYKAGLVDFSNVLDAQRSLLSFDDAEAQSAGAVTADLIRLYKALGGGWEPSGEDKPPATGQGKTTP